MVWGNQQVMTFVWVAIDLACCTIFLVTYLAWSDSSASVEDEMDLDLFLDVLTYSLHGTPLGAGSEGYMPCLVTLLSKSSGRKNLATLN